MQVPKWVEKRCEILWGKFQGSPFRFREAAKVLKPGNQDSEDQVNVILSELGKGGWLTMEFDPADARKRIYRLKSGADR